MTTGILHTLTAEELEGVIAHELSHVAHRDVLVMTVAATAGIVAGMVTRGAQWGGLGLGRSRSSNDSNGAIGFFVVLIISLVSLRDQLPAAAPALALPRALRRPLGRLPDPEAVGPGLGADQDQRPDERRARDATCAPPSR